MNYNSIIPAGIFILQTACARVRVRACARARVCACARVRVCACARACRARVCACVVFMFLCCSAARTPTWTTLWPLGGKANWMRLAPETLGSG